MREPLDMAKRALITGVTGQDGAYLSKLLLEKGYQIYGTTRCKENADLTGLIKLGIRNSINLLELNNYEIKELAHLFENINPDEIYLLGGQSSVGSSFNDVRNTMDSIPIATVNVFEALIKIKSKARIFHPSSSECFGKINKLPATEKTPFNPVSPYGIAKTSSHFLVHHYRDSHGIFASNGILFNHESPLRKSKFVTKKIVETALQIALKKQNVLQLGDISVIRDWSWAPDVVSACHQILQHNEPDDFIVATGKAHSLTEFIELVFAFFGLTWRNYVESDLCLVRDRDIPKNYGNPDKIKRLIGWEHSKTFKEMVDALCEAEIHLNSKGEKLQ
jgi:GDPmannose 4,6-dehydratase